MPHITLVTKTKVDGSTCRKCAEILARIERDGVRDRIDRFVTADERDPASEGMCLAARHGVARAPFFVVEDGGGVRVYESYLQLRKEILQREVAEHDEAREIMDRFAELDFV